MSDIIDIATRYGDFLRYCWLGALLHDLGKLSVRFVVSKERGSSQEDLHGQILYLDRPSVPGTLWSLLSTPLESLCETPPGFEGCALLYFMCGHHGCERCRGEHLCSRPSMKDHAIISMLQAADRVDGSNPADVNKQPLFSLKGSDFFGREYPLHPEYYASWRRKIYMGLARLSGGRLTAGKLCKAEKLLGRYLPRGLSETRKRAHDIDIFSHSRATALYMRLLLLDEIAAPGHSPAGREISFRVLRAFTAEPGPVHAIKRLLVDTLCLGAFLFDAPGEIVFILSSHVTLDCCRKLIPLPFELSGPFHIWGALGQALSGYACENPLPPGTMALDLARCFQWALDFRVAEPAEIAPGYTDEALAGDIAMLMDFAAYCDALELTEKRDYLLSHLRNLHRAPGDRRNAGAVEAAEKKLILLEQEIQHGKGLEEPGQKWGWKNRAHAAAQAWAFLARVLSPVRPPSPYEIARRWRWLIHEKLVPGPVSLVLARHLHLSRFYALMGDVKRVFRELRRERKAVMTDLSLSIPGEDIESLVARCCPVFSGFFRFL